MAPRLKVYRTQIGFHDAVVAAPSQKAARKAWDVREDLFASGAAAVTDDPDAVKAALAQPGVVLRRAVGASGPFTAEGSSPDLPRVPKRSAPTRPAARRDLTPQLPRPPPAPKPPPDRSALDAAEAALDALDAERKAALAALAAERAALDRRETALRADLEARQTKARQEVERQRDAFRRAGGD